MIVTVTCNPAIDVTYEVDAHLPGAVHRVDTVRERPGGKGVNVAAVLTSLGEDVVATGLADADFGAAVAATGIRADFVPTLPRVRRTTVVQAGETTSFWEPGPVLTDPARATRALVAKVEDLLAGATAVVVAGSLPPGMDPSLPARLAADAGVPAVLDVSGRALAVAADAGDAAAAAVARGLATARPWPVIVADAVALSAAAVMSPVAGEVALDAYRRWSGRVEVRTVTPIPESCS